MAYKGPRDVATPSLARHSPRGRQNVPGNLGDDVIQASAIVRMFMNEEDITGKKGALRFNKQVNKGSPR